MRWRNTLNHCIRNTMRVRPPLRAEAAEKRTESGRTLPKWPACHLNERPAADWPLTWTKQGNGGGSKVLKSDAAGAEVLVVHAHLKSHVASASVSTRPTLNQSVRDVAGCDGNGVCTEAAH